MYTSARSYPTHLDNPGVPDRQKSPDGRDRAKVERALREAGNSASYDQRGRVTKLTLAVSDNQNVSFSFTYDGQGRIQYIAQEDGTRMRLEYDSTGQWQGVAFPDGGRMRLVRDRAGSVVGFRAERPAARLRGSGAPAPLTAPGYAKRQR